MKIYLASNFGERYRMREIREVLQAFNHVVTSRWIDIEERFPEDADYRLKSAKMDIEDIDNADLLVCEVFEISRPQHGKHFELGYALAKGKQCWVAGDDFHIFHDLVHKKFKDIHGAIQELIRIDHIVGEGQVVEATNGFTQAQVVCLREYERVMREETIPEIERVMRQRAIDAQKSRHWIIG